MPLSASTDFARRVYRVIPQSERRGLSWLFGAVLIAAIFETLGVASILPFMAVVADPSVLDRSTTAQLLMGAAGIGAARGAIVAIGVVVVVVLLLSNLATAVSHWLQHTYLARVQQELSSELYAGFLAQPYAFHVDRDAASLATTVFNHVNAALTQALSPLLLGLARAVVAAALLGLLVLRDPVIAFAAFLLFGSGYIGVYRLVRGEQTRLGFVMAEAGEERYRLVMEGLGGVKELKVLGREKDTLARFYEASGLYFRSSSRSTVTSMLPRYLLETVAFGGIVLVTVLLVLQGGTVQAIIPTLALYAFAGYRLMPALQQIFASAVQLRFAGAAVSAVEADLALARRTDLRRITGEPQGRLPEDGTLHVDGVTFQYAGADRPALEDIQLTIHPNESIGLVGRTGSGKTTLADLLLGLHRPTEGILRYGGLPLDADNVRAWQAQVGYVPQSVFLANASVAENIAFGLARRDVDPERVREAARMAQATEFIESLPAGYDTQVGERGVRISGGQRQRLGIARALYHNPAFLVFDEATSALDGMTEEAVMEALGALTGSRTILLIAHRIKTVEACDRIVVLDAGRIAAVGSYEQLRVESPAFQRLLGGAAAGSDRLARQD